MSFSTERYSQAQDAAGAGFWYWDIISGELNWTEAFFRLLGLDPSKASACFETWRSVLHPADLQMAEERIAASIRDRSMLFNHYRIVLPSGALRWIEAYGNTDFDESGQALRMTGICIDVTQRIETEEALKSSELQYRLLIEQSPDGVFVADADGHYLDVNPSGAAMLGYSREEILAMNIPDIHDLDEEAQLPGAIGRYADGAVVTSEWRFRRKDGSTFIGEVVGRQLPDGRLQGVLRDITERKRIEQQLKYELDAMVRLHQLGTLIITQGDLTPVLTEVVDAAIAITGADFANIQLLEAASGDLHIVAQRGFPQWWLDFWDAAVVGHGCCGTALEQGQRVVVEDVELSPIFAATPALDIQRRAGVRAVQSTPLVSRSGKPLGMFSTHYRVPGGPDERSLRLLDLLARQAADMIERLQAEKALCESELFYRQVLESIPGMVFTTRSDGYCDYQSRQWVDYTGVPMPEHVGNGWNTLLHTDDQSRSYTAWRAAIEGRAPYDLEYRVRRHDGVYEWFRVIGRPIRDASGHIARWFGVAVNIEKLKQAEQALRDGESRLRLLIEHIPAAVAMFDRNMRYIAVNRRWVDDFGLYDRDIIGSSHYDVFREIGAELKAVHQRGMAGEVVVGENESFERTDGRMHWLRWEMRPWHDADGGVGGIILLSEDITERRKDEAERIAAVERQRDVLVREVHHRIKNHLQGVIGLMRNSIFEHPEIGPPMEEVVGRVSAIIQVYGLQGRRPDTQVHVCDLLRGIAESLTGAVPIVIERMTEGKEAILTAEEAVPIALVINELITNAVKHIESPDPHRPVRLLLDIRPDVVRLEVCGGPSWLPGDFDYASGNTVGSGLELVRALLQSKMTTLSYRQEGDMVVAELTLRPPVVSCVSVTT